MQRTFPRLKLKFASCTTLSLSLFHDFFLFAPLFWCVASVKAVATVANYQCDLFTLSKCVFLSAFHKFSPSVNINAQTNKFAINCTHSTVKRQFSAGLKATLILATTTTITTTTATTSITITSTLFSSQRDIFLLADLMSA